MYDTTAMFTVFEFALCINLSPSESIQLYDNCRMTFMMFTALLTFPKNLTSSVVEGN